MIFGRFYTKLRFGGCENVAAHTLTVLVPPKTREGRFLLRRSLILYYY